jgi:hypothetical protein
MPEGRRPRQSRRRRRGLRSRQPGPGGVRPEKSLITDIFEVTGKNRASRIVRDALFRGGRYLGTPLFSARAREPGAAGNPPPEAQAPAHLADLAAGKAVGLEGGARRPFLAAKRGDNGRNLAPVGIEQGRRDFRGVKAAKRGAGARGSDDGLPVFAGRLARPFQPPGYRPRVLSRLRVSMSRATSSSTLSAAPLGSRSR